MYSCNLQNGWSYDGLITEIAPKIRKQKIVYRNKGCFIRYSTALMDGRAYETPFLFSGYRRPQGRFHSSAFHPAQTAGAISIFERTLWGILNKGVDRLLFAHLFRSPFPMGNFFWRNVLLRYVVFVLYFERQICKRSSVHPYMPSNHLRLLTG